MPTTRTLAGRIKSRDELIARLRAAGIEPDLRQEGWPLTFATFPVTDTDVGPSVGKLSLALKSHYIKLANGIAFASRLRQITYSPILSDTGPQPNGTKLSHLHSENAVHIRARVDKATWLKANGRSRTRLLVGPLVEALDEVRATWLLQDERDKLASIFQSFGKVTASPSRP